MTFGRYVSELNTYEVKIICTTSRELREREKSKKNQRKITSDFRKHRCSDFG